jgi:hypothetical protein
MKSNGTGKPAAPAKAAAPPAKAGAPPAKAPGPPKPPPPKLLPANVHTMDPQEVTVCARPDGVHSDQYRWGFDKKDVLITQDVKRAVQQAGTGVIYVYDPGAPKENVDRMPYPFKNARCPRDTRPPAPPPKGVAPPAPPAPLASISSLLSAVSSGGGALPEPVALFGKETATFQGSRTQDGILARKFALRLWKAIRDNSSMNPVPLDELSVAAAGELFAHFKSDITAAMAHRQVVAPLNVQRKFKEFLGGNSATQWKLFVLVNDQWATGAKDTLPTVILPSSVYDKVKQSFDANMTNITTRAAAKQAYQAAYSGLPTWLKAIEPYFP